MSGVLRQTVKFTRGNYSRQVLVKRTCTTKVTPGPSKTAPSSPPPVKDVPGLSKNIVEIPKNEVGPGASKKSGYKNPEYFCYNNTSYFEAEVEMLKYRLPQPSNNAKK